MKRILFAATAVLALGTQASYAGGFMLMEQSAAGIGRANAGAGVFGDDASAAWFNPAGMTLLQGKRFQAGTALGVVDAKYESKNGGASDNAYDGIVPIPFMHTTLQLTDSVWAGLSIAVPFGMQTKYKDSFEAGVRGLSAKVQTIDVNPSIAFKVNDMFSVGVGVSAQYGSKELRTGQNSQINKVKGSDVAWGVNAGILFKPRDNMRFGLAWRSSVKHDLDGHMYMPSGVTYDTTVPFKTPQTVILSGAWDVNPQWTVAGTFRWSDWSVFKTLSVNSRQGGGALATTEENWKDCYLFSLGADYRYSDAWTFRAGAAYESSTIREDKYRMTTVPDSSRLWLSVGATWHASKQLQCDVGYLFLHALESSPITKLGQDRKPTDEVFGDYKRTNVHMFGVQAVYRF
ncbi:MAG TPA: hypothetical protein DD376_02685 [Sutterella sp.]|nr:hypothetical protein [Sutterella sp.]